MAFRLDVVSLRPPRTMADGRMLVDGALTRTGVFTYRNDDGSERREYRPDAEVFAPASLATLPGVPVTDDHPSQMLTIHDAAGKAVGAVVGEPRRDGAHLVATMSIWDAATIAKMKAGKTALSCGYDVDLVHKAGTSPSGERHDCIQTNIRFNHLAIVDAARAGATAKARMDSVQVFDCACEDSPDEADPGGASANKTAGEKGPKMDELKKALADLERETARADGLKADLEKERKERADEAKALPAKIKARVALLTAAAKALGDDARLDDMSDEEIQRAVVKRVDGVEIPADKGPVYVAARYDSALERAGSIDPTAGLVHTRELAARNDGLAGPVVSGTADKERAAMAKARQDALNAWRSKN